MRPPKNYSLKTMSKIFDDDFKCKIAFYDLIQNIEITYGQLRNSVHQCTEELKQYSDGNERKVLLFLDSGLLFVTVFYACLLAGRIPVLLNTKLKDELRSFDFWDCPVVTDKKNSQYIRQYMNIDEHQLLIFNIPTNPKEPNVLDYPEYHPDDAMTYLFTSGSMGEAKLVQKTFKNIMTEVCYLKELLTTTEEDIYLALVPSFHIYGLLYTVLLPLYTGSAIRLDIPFSPLNIFEDGILKNVNMVIANPTHYSAMSQFLEDFKGKDFSQLKYCISSTMPVDEDIIVQFYEMLKIKMIEFYGSTETGGIAYRKFYEKSTWSFFPQIKWSISERSELIVNSPMVSHGESQDRNFESLHCTGDLIDYDEKALGFSLIGRVNQIVKVAGNRVSCLEVEKVIREFPDVEDVVVLGFSSKGIDGEKLFAYLVTRNEKGFIKKIKYHCHNKLPDFKVPSRFIILDTIEKGANGKVLFSKLPKPKI